MGQPSNHLFQVQCGRHHRARTVCSDPQLLQQEEGHVSRVLTRCKYPAWAINRIKMKMETPAQKKSTKNNEKKQNNCQQPYIVVPYYQGLSESMKRTCNKYGVQVHFKGDVTIKYLLMAPKDQDPMLKRSGIIYRYKYDRVECNEEYIGGSSRTFGERLRNIKRPHPPYMSTITPLVTKLA